MRSGSRCPAFYGEIPPMRWGILNDDGGYFYCITYKDSSIAQNETQAQSHVCSFFYNEKFAVSGRRNSAVRSTTQVTMGK